MTVIVTVIIHAIVRTTVIVMVSSQHRKDSLEATSYIIDWLKIKSPFWKKEIYNDSEKWVEQNKKDLKIIDRFSHQQSH